MKMISMVTLLMVLTVAGFSQTSIYAKEVKSKTLSYYPVLGVEKLTNSSEFYIEHFGFELRFANDWYIHLVSTSDESINLALVKFDHESIPAGYRNRSSGLILNFEVDDVDAEYRRLQQQGVNFLLELRDEPWGQRHFILADPAGNLIDVIKAIPPNEEYAEDYIGQN